VRAFGLIDGGTIFYSIDTTVFAFEKGASGSYGSAAEFLVFDNAVDDLKTADDELRILSNGTVSAYTIDDNGEPSEKYSEVLDGTPGDFTVGYKLVTHPGRADIYAVIPADTSSPVSYLLEEAETDLTVTRYTYPIRAFQDNYVFTLYNSPCIAVMEKDTSLVHQHVGFSSRSHLGGYGYAVGSTVYVITAPDLNWEMSSLDTATGIPVLTGMGDINHSLISMAQVHNDYWYFITNDGGKKGLAVLSVDEKIRNIETVFTHTLPEAAASKYLTYCGSFAAFSDASNRFVSVIDSSLLLFSQTGSTIQYLDTFTIDGDAFIGVSFVGESVYAAAGSSLYRFSTADDELALEGTTETGLNLAACYAPTPELLYTFYSEEERLYMSLFHKEEQPETGADMIRVSVPYLIIPAALRNPSLSGPKYSFHRTGSRLLIDNGFHFVDMDIATPSVPAVSAVHNYISSQGSSRAPSHFNPIQPDVKYVISTISPDSMLSDGSRYVSLTRIEL
jgi:hypothetical protein